MVRSWFVGTCGLATMLILSALCPFAGSKSEIRASNRTKHKNLTVVFDLGGVLFSTDKMAAGREIGMGKLTWYAMTGNDPSKLKDKLYDQLNLIAENPTFTQKLGNYCGAQDHLGIRMPDLMVDWMTGARSAQEIRSIVLPAIKEQCKGSEGGLVHNLAKTMFTPEKFSKTQKMVPGAVKLISGLKKRGHRVCVLSNWGSESYRLIADKYPELFTLFDEVVISGDVGMMKPDAAIYELYTQKTTNPCVFVDDQSLNVKAAHKAGMYGIVCHQEKGLFGRKKSDPDLTRVRRCISLIEAHETRGFDLSRFVGHFSPHQYA